MSTPPGQNAAPSPSDATTLSNLVQQYGPTLNALMGGTSGSSSANGQIADNSTIFMGNTKAPTTGPGGEFQHGMSMPNNLSYQEARNLPTVWMETDPNKLKKLVNTGILNKVPGFSSGMGLPEIISAWDDLVTASYAINQGNPNGKKWTPWDVLKTYSNSNNKYGTVVQGEWEYDAATGAKIRYVGPKTKTTTSRDVNLSSAEDVKALTTSILTQALGRAPTAKEVAQYKSTINAQENSNPSLTTTTQTFNDQGEAVNQSTKTTGGFDQAAQQQLVLDNAAKTPEYAKYQSGTTYWNSLMSMLTGG